MGLERCAKQSDVPIRDLFGKCTIMVGSKSAASMEIVEAQTQQNIITIQNKMH
jgi:hypothetical protein